jgi:hypothetical protein
MRPSKEMSRINATLVPQERKFWKDVPDYIGLYADDALTLINGSPAFQNQWLDNARRWGVNYITLYNMSSVCIPSNFPKIANFIALAVSKGIKKVGGVFGSVSTVDKMKVYQDQAAIEKSLSLFLEEYEVWNLGGWATRKIERKKAFDIATGKTSPAIKIKVHLGIYFGWFKNLDAGMTADQAADTITTTTDYMMLHVYAEQPSWSRMLERLRIIDNSLQRTGFVGDYSVYILVSAESKLFKEKDGTFCPNEFSGQYLKTKTLRNWYDETIAKIAAYYQEQGDSAFKKVMIRGIWCFDYWWMNQTGK